MIQSMTGYGAAEAEGLKVEVRSLNHKYIDISVRMPSTLLEHEIPVRNIVKEKFARGKVDVIVSLSEKRQLKVRVNKELARGIHDALMDLQEEMALPGSLDIDFFSRYRELIMAEEPEFGADALFSALRDAVSRVEVMRKSEGEALMKVLQLHAGRLEELRKEVEQLSKNVVQAYKETLTRRVDELVAGIALDEARLAQEIAILAQKSDITEELARLGSHIQQFHSFLSGSDAVGRKLDFLMQEMHREANTITSKVDDVRIINLAIGMKTEIEKLREQVQNIQ